MPDPLPKLLVVDDKPANLAAMRNLLSRLEAEIVEADSGAMALSLFMENDFALALLDVHMPDMDGFEVVELLRGTRRTRDTPIIFITAAHPDERKPLQGYGAGAVDFIQKPVDNLILLSKVSVFLELHNRRREKERLVELLTERGHRLEMEIAQRQRMEEELRQHRDELDIRVAQRTSALQKANRALLILSACHEAIMQAKEETELVDAFTAILVAQGEFASARVVWQARDPDPCLEQIDDFPLAGGGVLRVERRSRYPLEPDMILLLKNLAVKLAHAITALRDSRQRQLAEAALVLSREQLRELAGHLDSVREDERRWLSQEIHDELGSNLAHMKMNLLWLTKGLTAGSADCRENLTGFLQLLDETIERVRGITHSLRPPALDQFGLPAALEWLVMQFEKNSGLPCLLHLPATAPDLDDARKTALFRICQESLTNISRHAAASRVAITLDLTANRVRLAMADNGCGFPAAVLDGKARSLGLRGMAERALRLGGTFEIINLPTGGAQIAVELPVNDPGAVA